IIAYSAAPLSDINYSYSVQVDATVQFAAPGISGNVGIVFNLLDNQNYCVAELTSKGYYRVWEKVDGSITTIQALTLNSAIQTGNSAKNTIKIIQGAGAVELIINGTSMGSFDIPLPGDIVKVGISASTGQNPAEGLFNNFIVVKI
ncbi:MAG TPA: hypothetical protein VMC08_02300, partial [Bacteroidales bacterium]|nr:hypothetical protein [Bacteroidales bacterium]